jgi:hypothetical protein
MDAYVAQPCKSPGTGPHWAENGAGSVAHGRARTREDVIRRETRANNVTNGAP